MTPEALAEALRLRLPNTETTLSDKPGRIIVKMAPKPHALTVFIALSKSGDRAEVSDADPTQRPRDRGGEPINPTAIMEEIAKIVTAYTTHNPYRFGRDPYVEPRIRAWIQLPDMPPDLAPRARVLLDMDRAVLAKLREEISLREADIAALERALKMDPTPTDPIRAAAERALSILEHACWDDGQDAYGLGEAREILRGALGVTP
jgi:hypothetical protein